MAGSDDIQTYLDQSNASTAAAVQSADNRGKVDPAGKVNNSTVNSVVSNSTVSLTNNPISLAGVDIVNQVVGSKAQALVGGINQQVTGALSNLNQITNSLFTAVALVSTAEIEVIMEIARGNARQIVTLLNQKDAIITSMQTDALALYNAVVVLLNTQPFSSAYIKNLLVAYADIQQSEKLLKGVVSSLTYNSFFNTYDFDQSILLLTDAQNLILPDPTANISAIQGGVPLPPPGASITQAKNALAAALVIPALTAHIALQSVQYTQLTIEINGLLALFTSALGSFVSAYQRNSNIDQATISHINSGITQIDSLLASMTPVLFPTNGSQNSPLYTSNVMAAATGWGLQLTPIIEFLKLSPAAAENQLNQTGESVKRYNAAVAAINALGNITLNLATLKVSAGAEDILNTGNIFLQVALVANTVVASQNNATNVLQQVRRLQDILTLATQNDSGIRNALAPFIQTPNNLINGADKIVSNLTSLANNLGMDRAASLLQSANISAFFSMTPATATFVGAASAGVKTIIQSLNSNPNATDQDKTALQNISTDMDRQNSIKTVESQRSASNNTNLFVAQQKQNQAATQLQGDQAIQVDKKYNGSTLSGDQAAQQQNLISDLNDTIPPTYSTA